MFRDALTQTPFTGGFIDEAFPNISGDVYRHDDNTFIATMRAILAPRMEYGDKANLYIESSGYMAHQIENTSKRKFVGVMYDDHCFSDGTLIIHLLRGNDEANAKAFEKIASAFTEVYPSFSAVDRFTMFFKKHFNSLCFINIEQRKTVLFVEDLGLREWHLLQRGITILFPWFFEGDKMFVKDDIEYKLLGALNHKTATKYIELLQQMAEPYDFKKLQIKRMLDGFEHRMERKELENLKHRIEDCLANMTAYNNSIREELRKKSDYEIRMLGLERKISEDSESSEIMDFFLSNRSVVLNSVENNGNMYFTVKTRLDNFSEEAAEAAINNKTSFIYIINSNSMSSYIRAEDMELLMRALFIDQILTINFCEKFLFNMYGEVKAIKNSPYSTEYDTYMPNPHLDYYGCLGNYKPIINDMLADNNYVGAITQCIASCTTLNFNDPPVMRHFMRNLYGIPEHRVNNRCINLPTGEVVTPKEAIAWLKSQQTDAAEANEEGTNE